MLLSLLAGMLIIPVRGFLLLHCVPSHNFFVTFSIKSFVVSRIIATFAIEFERTEKNGRDEDSND